MFQTWLRENGWNLKRNLLNLMQKFTLSKMAFNCEKIRHNISLCLCLELITWSLSFDLSTVVQISFPDTEINIFYIFMNFVSWFVHFLNEFCLFLLTLNKQIKMNWIRKIDGRPAHARALRLIFGMLFWEKIFVRAPDFMVLNSF